MSFSQVGPAVRRRFPRVALQTFRCSCGNEFSHQINHRMVCCFRCGAKELLADIRDKMIADPPNETPVESSSGR